MIPGLSDPLLVWKNLPKSEADWMPSEDDAAQAPVGGVAWMVKKGGRLREVLEIGKEFSPQACNWDKPQAQQVN